MKPLLVIVCIELFFSFLSIMAIIALLFKWGFRIRFLYYIYEIPLFIMYSSYFFQYYIDIFELIKNPLLKIYLIMLVCMLNFSLAPLLEEWKNVKVIFKSDKKEQLPKFAKYYWFKMLGISFVLFICLFFFFSLCEHAYNVKPNF